MPAQRTAIADNWAALPIFEDTVPALTQLKNDGWKLAVLTNCDEDLFAQTQRAIGLPFNALVTAERVRSYKPALAHFEYFRDRVLGEGDEWVHGLQLVSRYCAGARTGHFAHLDRPRSQRARSVRRNGCAA
jgi:2-haloacid dehalogenase